MKIEAYAKVNLSLEVFSKRSDGYHAIRSLVMPVSLSDTIDIDEDIDLESDSGYSDDLMLKAAKVLRANAAEDGRSHGARIHVEKRIPSGGGLGGGSADAAAVLVALNDMWGLGFSVGELSAIGAEVGSDVPALVLAQGGGPVLMEGRGERVSSLPPLYSDRYPVYHLVLANPGVPCSTADVYARSAPRAPNDPSIIYNMRPALESGDAEKLAATLMNDLEAPALSLHPRIAEAREALADAGAMGVTMTGSGSTVFGIVPDEETGRRMASALSAQGMWSRAVHTIVP